MCSGGLRSSPSQVGGLLELAAAAVALAGAPVGTLRSKLEESSSNSCAPGGQLLEQAARPTPSGVEFALFTLLGWSAQEVPRWNSPGGRSMWLQLPPWPGRLAGERDCRTSGGGPSGFLTRVRGAPGGAGEKQTQPHSATPPTFFFYQVGRTARERKAQFFLGGPVAAAAGPGSWCCGQVPCYAGRGAQPVLCNSRTARPLKFVPAPTARLSNSRHTLCL